MNQMKKLQAELQAALEAAREAGKEIMDVYQRDFQVDYKSDKSPLTEADLRADGKIIDILSSAFPSYPILTEETVDDFQANEHSWCWIVDPVDGTKEFIKKNDEFTVNIALTYEKIIVLGVVYAPVFDEMYFAVDGHGAYLQLGNQEPEQIWVSDRVDQLRVLQSRSHQSKRCQDYVDRNLDRIETVTAMGSSLKGCRIAKGDYEVYYNCGRTMIWDTAAMEVIITEAGGILRQLTELDIVYDLKKLANDQGFYILNDMRNKL